MQIIFIRGAILFSFFFLCSCFTSKVDKQEEFALAAAKGDFTTVKKIFEKDKININAVNGKIGPALVSASYGGHIEIVQFLLDNGADINVRDEKQTTPLMNAVIGEKPEIVKVLLQRGADPNLIVTSENEDNRQITALTFAKIKQNQQIIEAIENSISQKNPTKPNL